MIPLLDGDILLYEVGFGAETGWKGLYPESPDPPPWDYVANMVDERIKEICRCVEATTAPQIYLTGKGNFREKIAKKKGYKAHRAELVKPFHYSNIKAYLIGVYNAEVVDGIEADDAICIAQCLNLFDDNLNHEWPYTIICTRDKDLRQCPGWHFGWELGNQPQFGPLFINAEDCGEIALTDKKEIKGYGSKFFYSQLITGDKTDNIPGLPRKGAKAAFELLSNTNTLEEMEKAVVEAYRGFYGDVWREELLEQAYLLWMVRELDEEGKPIMFELTYA